jgi:hypothetical protein
MSMAPAAGSTGSGLGQRGGAVAQERSGRWS